MPKLVIVSIIEVYTDLPAYKDNRQVLMLSTGGLHDILNCLDLLKQYNGIKVIQNGANKVKTNNRNV